MKMNLTTDITNKVYTNGLTLQVRPLVSVLKKENAMKKIKKSLLIKQTQLNGTINSSNIKKVQLDENLSHKEILNHLINPIKINGEFNSFQKVNFYLDDAKNLKDNSINYWAKYQGILLEFDFCNIDKQILRIRETVKLIPTMSYMVYSGNKSWHLLLYFESFALNSKDFKQKCYELLAFLAENLPEYYQYPKSRGEKGINIPDLTVLRIGALARQLNGIRDDNRKKQVGEVLNSGKPLCIDKFLVDAKIPTLGKPKGSITEDIVKKNYSDSELDLIKSIKQTMDQHNFQSSEEATTEVFMKFYDGKLKTIDFKEVAYFDHEWKILQELEFPVIGRPLGQSIYDLKAKIIKDYSDGNKGLAKDFISSLIKYFRNGGKMKKIYNYIRSYPEIGTSINSWDSDPNIFLMKNQVLEFSKKEIFVNDLSPKYLGLLNCNVNYIEDSNNMDCPRFNAFLEQITGNDPELIKYILKNMAYGLTGHISEQNFTILYGPSGTGKSTLAAINMALVGSYGAYISFSTLEKRWTQNGNSYDLARLPKKRLIVATESSPGSNLNE